MINKNTDFLNSFNLINENQAEYSILLDIYKLCSKKVFFLELEKLSIIKECLTDVVKYINSNYKSYDVKRFSVDIEGIISQETVFNKAGTSYVTEELMNEALKISGDNNSYLLVQSKDALVLFKSGEFDSRFQNTFADRQRLIELDSQRKDIDQLEWVFEQFQLQRKYEGCEYVKSGKISNNITEKQLRNHLISFLEKNTKLRVVTELCTSKQEDEESVDIGVIDSNKRVAIIEVKYFVMKGLFEDNAKKAYAPGRFRDGYRQLNRYCIHLNADNYDLHSAFLYMFYAHNKEKSEIEKIANKYLDQFYKEIGDEACSESFRNHYKETIYDNMLNIKM